MPRISPVDPSLASDEQRPLFDSIEKKMGRLPNVLKTLGHSPAALDAYIKLSAVQDASSFSAKERELLALAISAENDCQYCVSAHSAIASQMRVSPEAAAQAMSGQAEDPKLQAAITLAKALTANRGWVDDDALASVKSAGLSDQSIMDVVLAVTVNTLTNYANHLADTEVDFPVVELSGS